MKDGTTKRKKHFQDVYQAMNYYTTNAYGVFVKEDIFQF
jgi:hypothetical protein